LLPFLLKGATVDAATHAYLLCRAHHNYIWGLSAAKHALAGAAVLTLATASAVVLGPLAAAAGWALAATSAPLLSKDVWRSLRGYLRGPATRKQAELVAAAATAAGGQALVLQDEVARLVG